MERESSLNADLTIKAKNTSAWSWSSKGPQWTISLVDQDTFRFSAADTEESFDHSLAVIEEHAHLFELPVVSYAYISLKPPKQKKVFFRIDKTSIPTWNQMKGPPTLQGLALTLKRVTKPDIPWGIMLVASSVLPNPDEEKHQLIQDLDSALLGISLIGIAVIARKIPQANFFLFQMVWELIFLCNVLVSGTNVGGDTNMLLLSVAFFVFFLLIFRHRMIQNYENYKRFSNVA